MATANRVALHLDATRRVFGAALLALPLAAMSCAPRPTSLAAQQRLKAYLRAIADDDPEEAYALLDPQLRERLEIASFRRRWKTLKPELASQARVLARRIAPRAAPLPIVGILQFPADERAVATLVDDRWRVSRGLAEVTPSSTPRLALVALLEAIGEHDYDGARELLSAPMRDHLERALSRPADQLRRALQYPAEIRARKARISLPDGGSVELELQADGWRVSRIE